MMTPPLLTLGSNGTDTVNLALANGITPETYLPMLRPLMNSHRIVCLPPRALWAGQSVPAELGYWDELAYDLLSGLEMHDLTNVIAMGHSFGAVASMIAATLQPERFKALVLLDPTVLLPHVLDALRQMREAGTIADGFHLAARAAKRQRTFESYDVAYAYFHKRGAFRDWTEEAMRAYVQHGLAPNPDGSVTLKWSPEWETYYFKTGYLKTWEMIPKLATLNIPTLILRGGTSDTYLSDAAERVRELMPKAIHLEIDGHGHLFPQSAPDEAGMIIHDWLAKL
jgi:pimeloyl-ACP methyl ester carboxylesterase